jgi:tetratricopeptide (TPR) repeat protein
MQWTLLFTIIPIAAGSILLSLPLDRKRWIPASPMQILRVYGGIDYSKWDNMGADDQQVENLFLPTLDENMNLMKHHAADADAGADAKDDDESEESEEEQDPDWLCNLGEMESCAGFVEKAERAFQRALQINRSHVQTLVSYGKMLVERQDYEKAEGMFATALKLDPANLPAQKELQELCNPDAVLGDCGPDNGQDRRDRAMKPKLCRT